MAYDVPDLDRVEGRFRQVLSSYDEARTRCDLLETLFGIHTALEDTLKAYLHEKVGLQPRQIVDLSFWEMAEIALPEGIVRDFELAKLHGHRSTYAHPRRPYESGEMNPFTNEEIRRTAVGLAEFASVSWRQLFDSDPPEFSHPPLPQRKLAGLKDLPPSVLKQMVVKRLARALDEEMAAVQRLGSTIERQETEIKELKRRVTRREVRADLLWGSDVRWLALVSGVLALLPLPWLTGVAHSLRLGRPMAWYWLVIPALPFLVLSFYAVRGLWRFVRSVGTLRLVAALSTALLVSTAVLTPFMTTVNRAEHWADGAGTAFSRIVGSVAGAVEAYTLTAYRQGDALTTRLLFGGTPKDRPAGQD